MNRSTLKHGLELLFVLSFMDLKLKYQNSVLGFFWSFIKPFLQFIVYYTIFGLILKVGTGADYPLRLFFGVLIWSWFAEATSLGLNAYIGKKAIITKIKTNKIYPPLAAFLTPTMNFFLNISIFLGAYCAFMPHFPTVIFSWLNFLILLSSLLAICAFIIAVNLILSCLNVLYRDMQPIWELILTYGVFLTPIIYQLPVPKKYELLYYSINLLAFPIENLKSIFFKMPRQLYLEPTITWSYSLVLLLLCYVAYRVYRSLRHKLVDFL